MPGRHATALVLLLALTGCAGSDLDDACRRAASLPVMTETFAATDPDLEGHLQALSDAVDTAEASDSDAATGLVAALNAWHVAVDEIRGRRRTAGGFFPEDVPAVQQALAVARSQQQQVRAICSDR